MEELKANLSTSGLSQVVNELANLTASQANDSSLYSGELETVTKALDSLATMTSTNINVTDDISKVRSTHECLLTYSESAFTLFQQFLIGVLLACFTDNEEDHA